MPALTGVGGSSGLSDSRFLIQLADDAGYLDGRYVAFGRVSEGMEVVRRIEGVRVSGDGDGLPEGGCMSRSASELALEGRGGAEEDDSDDNLSGVLGGDAEDSEEDSDDFSGVL